MIAFVLFALSISQSLADTIIRDDPARFDSIATDANGNYVPVSGEVDTVQVFNVRQSGQQQQFNDTGLAVNVTVSGLNQSNNPHIVRYITIPPYQSLPAPPPRFWNLNIPLQNATASTGTNITGLSYAPPKLFGFWSPSLSSSATQNGSRSTFAPFQYPNFGFKRFANQDDNRAGGPRADEAFAKSGSGLVDKDGDYNSLDAMGEKGNTTLSSILGRLVDMITAKRDDNTHILAEYVDDYPNYDYDATKQSPVAKEDDSIIDINPQIYADIWNPAKWNSFTNISFDKDQPSSSIGKSSSGLWNEALWTKLAAIQRNATRDLNVFGAMPQWTLNYSSPEVQQFVQNAFLLNLTKALDGLNNSASSALLPQQLTQQMSTLLRTFLKALSPPGTFAMLTTNSSATIPSSNLPFFNVFAPYNTPTSSIPSTGSNLKSVSTTKPQINSMPTSATTTVGSQPDMTQLLSSINTVLQKLNRNMASSSDNDSTRILDKSIVIKDTKRLSLAPEQDEIIVDTDLDDKDEYSDEPSIASPLLNPPSGASRISPFSPLTLVVGMFASGINRFLRR